MPHFVAAGERNQYERAYHIPAHRRRSLPCDAAEVVWRNLHHAFATPPRSCRDQRPHVRQVAAG
ncbi:MAG: hypothetical protein OJF49_002742 [Ktedonobacterales bacterium]|nr:MAG: hypothetical protein OJF49_002742 [Ktedonobacterales bacterium]